MADIFQIGEPVCGITSVAFSVSGRLLFAGYDDFECKVLELCSEWLVQTDYNRYGMFFVEIVWEHYKVTTTE